MRFVYLEGPYAEFRGIPFVNGKPSTVDQATAEALRKRADYREVAEEIPAAPSVLAEPRRPLLHARRGRA